MEIKDGAVFASRSEERCAKEQPRESAWDSQELHEFPKFGQLTDWLRTAPRDSRHHAVRGARVEKPL